LEALKRRHQRPGSLEEGPDVGLALSLFHLVPGVEFG
jgi:hypothetical protein